MTDEVMFGVVDCLTLASFIYFYMTSESKVEKTNRLFRRIIMQSGCTFVVTVITISCYFVAEDLGHPISIIDRVTDILTVIHLFTKIDLRRDDVTYVLSGEKTAASGKTRPSARSAARTK